MPTVSIRAFTLELIQHIFLPVGEVKEPDSPAMHGEARERDLLTECLSY